MMKERGMTVFFIAAHREHFMRTPMKNAAKSSDRMSNRWQHWSVQQRPQRTKIESFMYAIDRRVFQAALSPWIQIFTSERLARTLNVTRIGNNFRKCIHVLLAQRRVIAAKCSGENFYNYLQYPFPRSRLYSLFAFVIGISLARKFIPLNL